MDGKPTTENRSVRSGILVGRERWECWPKAETTEGRKAEQRYCLSWTCVCVRCGCAEIPNFVYSDFRTLAATQCNKLRGKKNKEEGPNFDISPCYYFFLCVCVCFSPSSPLFFLVPQSGEKLTRATIKLKAIRWNSIKSTHTCLGGRKICK